MPEVSGARSRQRTNPFCCPYLPRERAFPGKRRDRKSADARPSAGTQECLQNTDSSSPATGTARRFRRERQTTRAATALKEKLNDIVIQLLCTYESENFSRYNDEGLKEFIDAYENEVRQLKKYFDDNNNHPLKSKLKIVLILFPVQSKKELVSGLHRNLSRLQSVGEVL